MMRKRERGGLTRHNGIAPNPQWTQCNRRTLHQTLDPRFRRCIMTLFPTAHQRADTRYSDYTAPLSRGGIDFLLGHLIGGSLNDVECAI